MPKAFLIDTTRCIACRGCQIACKEVHNLQAVKTTQRGTHQNPPDLTPFNYKLVRFQEHFAGGAVRWNFFPDQCRHCLSPSCLELMEEYSPSAVVKDKETAAVIYTSLTAKLSAEEFEEVRQSCPYNIPRRDPVTGVITKCDMCVDRIRNNLKPVCVTVCPTGAMKFGERKEVLRLAEKRLGSIKKEFPRASLADPGNVSVIYLLADIPKRMHRHAVAV